jgi:hypothetical protein
MATRALVWSLVCQTCTCTAGSLRLLWALVHDGEPGYPGFINQRATSAVLLCRKLLAIGAPNVHWCAGTVWYWMATTIIGYSHCARSAGSSTAEQALRCHKHDCIVGVMCPLPLLPGSL